jgi:hypothetical protein
MKDPQHNPKAALITVEPDGLGIESGDPRFDRARQILEGVKMTCRMNIAGQVMLGGELFGLKEELGFNGSGRRKERSQVATFDFSSRTWDDHCKAELGISHDCADRFITCFRIIQKRGEALGEDSPAFRLLCVPVSTLGEDDRQILQRVVNELLKGDSQKDLLQELKIIRGQHRLKGGDTSESKKAAAQEATVKNASQFFRMIFNDLAGIEKAVSRQRHNPSFDAWLYLLPLATSEAAEVISLTDYQSKVEHLAETIEADLQDLLTKVGKAIESKMASCNPPSRTITRRKKTARKNKP